MRYYAKKGENVVLNSPQDSTAWKSPELKIRSWATLGLDRTFNTKTGINFSIPSTLWYSRDDLGFDWNILFGGSFGSILDGSDPQNIALNEIVALGWRPSAEPNFFELTIIRSFAGDFQTADIETIVKDAETKTPVSEFVVRIPADTNFTFAIYNGDAKTYLSQPIDDEVVGFYLSTPDIGFFVGEVDMSGRSNANGLTVNPLFRIAGGSPVDNEFAIDSVQYWQLKTVGGSITLSEWLAGVRPYTFYAPRST